MQIIDIDEKRLIQSVNRPSVEESTLNDPRIQSSDCVARAWFNPSIQIINGQRRMLYRVEAKPFFRLAQIGHCKLNSNWLPLKRSNFLYDLKSIKGKLFAEDPRWIQFGDQWLISFTDSYNQGIATLNEDFSIKDSWFLDWPRRIGQRAEKNWAFFTYDGSLHAVYTIDPHGIVKVEGKTAKIIHVTNRHCQYRRFWNWGEPRGGCSPVLHDGLWYHWFHSSSEGFLTRWGAPKQYHIGLYAFEPTPPFKVVGYVPKPVLSANIKETIPQDRPSQHRVVFPCGAIREEDGWRLSYGWNDCRIKMLVVKDSELEMKWL